jgi:hypothetical protein
MPNNNKKEEEEVDEATSRRTESIHMKRKRK